MKKLTCKTCGEVLWVEDTVSAMECYCGGNCKPSKPVEPEPKPMVEPPKTVESVETPKAVKVSK